jgi:hypothetical protein
MQSGVVRLHFRLRWRDAGWEPNRDSHSFLRQQSRADGYGSLALPWDNVRDRYLGLVFEIQGKNHFGWARLSVQFSSRQNTWRAQLTGYAYETVADRPIKAGQIQEQGDAAAGLNVPAPDPAQIASLGGLALGADGIALWRREESESGSRVA